MWSQPHDGSPEDEARAFVSAAKEVPDAAAALAGARDICAERIAEHADVRKLVREAYAKEGVIKVAEERGARRPSRRSSTCTRSFEEPVANIPSHRYLAIRRGEAEGVLRASIELAPEPLVPKVHAAVGLKPKSPWAGELDEGRGRRRSSASCSRRSRATCASTSRCRPIAPRSRSSPQNLRELLLAAPFGTKAVLGIDPGQRTGCKCAVVDDTGKLLEHTTIYLVQEQRLARARAPGRCAASAASTRSARGRRGQRHARPRDRGVREGRARRRGPDGAVFCVPVSEAGASVYSASDVAREEFPDLDLTVRGAISIARAPAGSAGRAGEGRPEEHRRRPVPARRLPGPRSRRSSTRWSRAA